MEKKSFADKYKKILIAICNSVIDETFKSAKIDNNNIQSFLGETVEKLNKEILSEIDKIIHDYICFVSITISEEAKLSSSANGMLYDGEGIVLNSYTLKGFKILYLIIGRFPINK